MPIRFYCPLGHRLVVPDDRAGKKGRCPECHQKVYVPVANPRPSSQQMPVAPGHEIELDELIGEVLESLPELRANIVAEAPANVESLAAAVLAGNAYDDDEGDDIELCDTPGPEIDAYSNPSLQLPPAALAPTSRPQAAPSRETAPAPTPIPQPAPAKQMASAAPIPVKRSAAPIPVSSLGAAQPTYTPPAPAPLPAAAMNCAAPVPAPNIPVGVGPEVIFAAPQSMGTRDWIRRATPDTACQGSRPDAGNLQKVYLLASALLMVALLGAWPGLKSFSLPEHATWTRIVVGMAASQLIYALWLLTVPDWSTLRVGMFLCAACAAAYAGALALVLATPLSEPVRLGLNPWRNTAGGWSAANVFVLGAACYAFGHCATQWRRETWRRMTTG